MASSTWRVGEGRGLRGQEVEEEDRGEGDGGAEADGASRVRRARASVGGSSARTPSSVGGGVLVPGGVGAPAIGKASRTSCAGRADGTRALASTRGLMSFSAQPVYRGPGRSSRHRFDNSRQGPRYGPVPAAKASRFACPRSCVPAVPPVHLHGRLRRATPRPCRGQWRAREVLAGSGFVRRQPGVQSSRDPSNQGARRP